MGDFLRAVLLVDTSPNQIADAVAADDHHEVSSWKSLRSLKSNIAANYLNNMGKRSPVPDNEAVVKARGLLTWYIPVWGPATISVCCPFALNAWVMIPTWGTTFPIWLLSVWC